MTNTTKSATCHAENNSDSNNNKSIEMAEIMTPNMANFTGKVHGGYLLSFLDKVAYACAVRYCGSPCVTLSVDRVYFKEPINVGEIVICKATINFVGNTSMEVGIKVEAENITTRKRRHTNTCYFTMIAVDEKTLKPIQVPTLNITSTLEQRRFDEAKARREARLQFYREHEVRKEKEVR